MRNLSDIRRRLKHVLPLQMVDWALKLKYRNRLIEGSEHFVAAVRGGKGLEIGGPSTVFKTMMPAYQAARSVDGANFAGQTVWEGAIQSGKHYRYLGNRVGHQFISDATDLSEIASGNFDFVLSSNCLEQVANPIQALLEWRRILRPRGSLILVLPNKNCNFDHRRSITTLEHMIDDHRSGVTEHDLTHLAEILDLHDLSRDPPAGDFNAFRQRSMENLSNRTLHHHVFDTSTMKRLLMHVGFDVERTTTTETDHYALATKREE